MDSSVLLELVRTPRYSTWQGEQWLFCCASAMVHIGEWTRADLVQLYPDDPLTAFSATFAGSEPWMWDYLPPSAGQGTGWGFYVFACSTCGRHRGHFDMT